jgi:hypothetical protein
MVDGVLGPSVVSSPFTQKVRIIWQLLKQ